MDFWCPDDDAPTEPAWWAPLLRFGLAMARAGLPALDPDEFVLMGRLVRRGPDLWLYQNRHSRRYATLDERGVPYRYVPPKSAGTGAGRHLAYEDPTDAWWHLDLRSLGPSLRAAPRSAA